MLSHGMRFKSALGQVGLSQVSLGQLGLVLYSLLSSIKDGVSFIKNVQQNFEGIMFGPIYIVGLSTLFIYYSAGPKS